MLQRVVVYGHHDVDARVAAYSKVIDPQYVLTSGLEDVNDTVLVDLQGHDDNSEAARVLAYGAWVVTRGCPSTKATGGLCWQDYDRLIIAQPARYDPWQISMRNQISTGVLGDLVSMRWIVLTGEDSWLPRGVIEDHAYSKLDAMAAILGIPQRVMACTLQLKRNVPDTLIVTMVAPGSGAQGYLEICCCHPTGCDMEQIEVVGTKGMLEYHSDMNRTIRQSWDSKVVRKEAFWHPPLESMIAEYVSIVSAPVVRDTQLPSTSAAIDLVDRVVRSSATNQPQ
ncbi:MAG: Gfo/Idh/MocA family protein [Anaerolineae bacterium]